MFNLNEEVYSKRHTHQSKHWRARNLRQRAKNGTHFRIGETYRLRNRPRSGYFAGLNGRQAYYIT